MVNKFLHLPHWKLFILVVGVPFVTMIVLMIILFATLMTQHNPRPESVFPIFFIFPIIALIAFTVQFYWQWSVATGLNGYLNPETRLRLKRFKFFFFVPLIYFGIIFIGGSFILPQFQFGNGQPPSIGFVLPFILIMMLMHFFSIFCLIYIIYFIAKTLKSVELQREAHFSDYIGEFFLMWFFPVGIWFIQPRINKIVQAGKKDASLIDEGV